MEGGKIDNSEFALVGHCGLLACRPRGRRQPAGPQAVAWAAGCWLVGYKVGHWPALSKTHFSALTNLKWNAKNCNTAKF